jgi:hypothetical protein
MSKKIIAWSLVVVWDDETEETIADLPTYVITEIDDFLTTLEQEKADE